MVYETCDHDLNIQNFSSLIKRALKRDLKFNSSELGL